MGEREGALPADLVTRALLQLSGLTQTEMAKRVGKTRAFISAIATGKSQPSLETALAIEDAAECPGAFSGAVRIIEIRTLSKDAAIAASAAALDWLQVQGFIGSQILAHVPFTDLCEHVLLSAAGKP